MTSTNHENDFVPASRGDLVASPYRAPLADIKLALDVAGLDDLLTLEDYADVDRESVHAALDGFASLAEGVIAPTDRVGDVTGAQFNAASSTITTPPFFREAYAQYVDGGWGALPFPLPFGGGGMPGVVGLANQEMFASANMALSLNPVLTQSVIEGLLYWGSDEQRAVYLPKLLTGEWSGTMNLTEAEAGSDLGEIKSLATPDANGEWRLTGTKIFITWGQHDLTENIIHLVLARTPDAPTGTKGLSLFVVPTIEVQPDGSLGDANSVHCLRIETKMGIHGSPTCEMRFEEARCELVGPLHGGMRAMFTVMNAARLSIGAQGPAIAERAFQQARGYAEGRLQGRNATTRPPSRSPIIDHPDVRRMLLSVATSVQAARLLLYVARAHEDRARHASDFAIKERSEQFANLLTPVAKAWSTDIGFSASSLSLQVLGGTGYMEEIGMTQRLRDARIPPIYEGTNGIQAIDLVTRKIPRDAGLWGPRTPRRNGRHRSRTARGHVARPHVHCLRQRVVDPQGCNGVDAAPGKREPRQCFGGGDLVPRTLWDHDGRLAHG